MAAKSWLIDTAKSMIVVNPKDFPMGLGAQPREDWPTESVGVMLYEAKNVMPTPFGYKSFFDQSQRFQVGQLTDKKVQDVFCYQTADMRQVLVALCEDGIYVANATTGSATAWVRIVDLSAGEVVGVRRLWTRATIGNRVFLYQQGQPKVWALVTPDVYAEAATPSPVAGATRTQVWTNWNMGLVSYIPNFINMAGQLGIFRADNRLGMWDSANAVAWSSANYIEDFKPNAQTFAGVTTFTDVQGRIIKILGSGDAFVIYATASIVYCSSLQGTPEKWRGSAIASDIGVSFDIQVVAAQPDTTQFALTSAGMMYIKDAQFQYILPEVTDYLAGENEVLALSMIEGRHLFIHCANVFPGSRYGVESKILKDFNNNEFKFPAPVGGTPDDGFGDLLEDYISGANSTLQDAFKDYEQIPDAPPLPNDDTLLEPCYDIKTFESTWADTTFTPTPTGNYMLASELMPGVQYNLTNYLVRPTVTNNSIYTNSNMPGDWSGQDVIDKLDQGMTKFNAQVEYQNAWIQALLTGGTVAKLDTSGGTAAPPPDYTGQPLTAAIPKTYVGEYTLINCVNPADLIAESNECRILLATSRRNSIKAKVYFEGTETYSDRRKAYQYPGAQALEPGLLQEIQTTYPGFHLLGGEVGPSRLGIPNPSVKPERNTRPTAADFGLEVPEMPKCLFAAGYNFDLIQEFTNYGTSQGFLPEQLNSSSITYLLWMLAFHRDLVTLMEGDSIDNFLARMDLGRAWGQQKGIYQGNENTISYYHPVIGVPDWSWIVAALNTQVSYASAGDEMSLVMEVSYPLNPLSPMNIALYINTNIELTVNDPGMYTPRGGPTTIVCDILRAIFRTIGGDSYDSADLAAWDNLQGRRGYKLEGNYTAENEWIPDSPSQDIVYEAELSGWGYTPHGGFSFRKTHTRHSSTTCPMPTSAYSYKPSTPDPVVVVPNEGSDGGKLNPPYKWEYPDAIPFPDNFVLYQQGSLAPYYPLYAGAVVYDSLLEKFGVYNEPHYLVYETLPVNRSDNTVMPVVDVGMYAGCLDVSKAVTVFTPNTPRAMATWGKVGYYRLGMTNMYEARAYFKEKSYGHLIVEVSMDGIAVDPSLTLAVEFNGESSAFLPFTACGKWFNIRVEGQFNLNTLQVNSESAGRR